MLSIVTLTVAWSLIVGACAFAWWKGGQAERWGGTLNLAINLIATPLYLLPAVSRQTGLLVVDGLLAFGLLFLAVRYANLWIGVAMIMQAIQFMLHTYYYVMERPHDSVFATVNDLVIVGILLSIFTGTLLSWRRRNRLPPATH